MGRFEHADRLLPDTVESSAEARKIVGEVLSHLPPETLEVVLLLTTELVTNAMRHGEGPVMLHLDSRDENVRVQVDDDGWALPVLRAIDVGSTGGRGLLLVDALATSWGVQQHRSGKGVWFTLDA